MSLVVFDRLYVVVKLCIVICCYWYVEFGICECWIFMWEMDKVVVLNFFIMYSCYGIWNVCVIRMIVKLEF